MKKILKLLFPVLALAGGVFAGDMLRSAGDAEQKPAEAAAGDADAGKHTDGQSAKEDAEHAAPTKQHAAVDDGHGGGSHGDADPGAEAWFTFPSQFFVPMMRNGDMGAMMILTLTIETLDAELEPMKQQEHRLRDALLRQLLVLANTGAFDGNFTAEPNLRVLRDSLLEAARQATSLTIRHVLIEDIARQGSS